MNCRACRGACCESFSAEIQMIPFDKDAQRWLELHATSVQQNGLEGIPRLTFECRCVKLTSDGMCEIWEDRPLVCELFIAGSDQCLETVKKRRTPEEYQQIRGEDDPGVL